MKIWSKTRYLHHLKSSFHKSCIHQKGKIIILYFYHVRKDIKANISNPGIKGVMFLPVGYIKYSTPPLWFLAKVRHLSLYLRKFQANLNCGTFCKLMIYIPGKYHHHQRQRRGKFKTISHIKREFGPESRGRRWTLGTRPPMPLLRQRNQGEQITALYQTCFRDWPFDHGK